METESKQNNLSTPIAIVIAGAFIALALYFGGNGAGAAVVPQPQDVQQPTGNLEAMKSVGREDHIRGDANAAVKIVEYSDTECPFCKRFHSTMQQIMTEYGDSDKVAWVYRHFPLDQLHSRARKEAEATECAAELGGNDKFWAYLDRLMEVTPANNGLDPAELPKIAGYVGLDENKFNICLTSGKYAQKIEEHVQNAVATGGNGTPWSIVVAKNGKKYPLSGAQPYEAVKQLIELALKEK
ncbi:DsbA family protein [Patescibacteria group bacterium]|nr:DsbA family protein [Patescibacteria group bacterium]